VRVLAAGLPIAACERLQSSPYANRWPDFKQARVCVDRDSRCANEAKHLRRSVRTRGVADREGVDGFTWCSSTMELILRSMHISRDKEPAAMVYRRSACNFRLMASACAAVWFAALATGAEPSEPAGGALAGDRPRLIVSTDVGGSDPDDYQSLVHLLHYADVLDIEGLISSPPESGRVEHILEVIEAYAQDYPKLKQRSSDYPAPDALRSVAKQGAIDAAPPSGWSQPTAGSQWIIQAARADDPRPVWVLVWGSIT